MVTLANRKCMLGELCTAAKRRLSLLSPLRPGDWGDPGHLESMRDELHAGLRFAYHQADLAQTEFKLSVQSFMLAVWSRKDSQNANSAPTRSPFSWCSEL
jgi:hypothetical protein